jgi:flavorubredoxin
MADVLNYLTGLRPKGLVGGVFGSHGWSGEATGQLRDALERMNAEIVEDPVRAIYRSTSADLQRCYELGLKVSQSIQDRQAAV